MTKITTSLFLAILIGLFLHVAAAQAQLVRTCVSMAKGSDSNSASNCHCTTPCRTFATAAANTLADGEITVLDPGDYGGLTITRSISINNDSGGEASITVPGGNTGIIVNAAAGAYVNLRGLTIQGVGFGTTTGLQFNSGLFLTITQCVVRNHTGNGISFIPNASSNLSVSNTLVADNGANGIFIAPTLSPVVRGMLDRVTLLNNGFAGLNVSGSGSTNGGIGVQVVDSVAANNGSFQNGGGFVAQSTAGHSLTGMWLFRSVASNNFNSGVVAFGPLAAIEVSQSMITNNISGWLAASGSQIRSYGDNVVSGNASDEGAKPLVGKM